MDVQAATLGEELDALPLSLDKFAHRYTSEDNDSFERQLEKDARDHVRKYWWAYDDVGALRDAGIDVPDISAPGIHLLSDGTRISADRRLRADRAANSRPQRGDERANVLNFAAFRARNNLMFPAEGYYEEEDPNAMNNKALTQSKNPRVEAAESRKGPPKEIARANTRFVDDDDDDHLLAPSVRRFLVRRHADESPMSSSSSSRNTGYADLSEVSSLRSYMENNGRQQQDGVLDTTSLVPMTPLIEPGSAEDPGLVTWGTLAAAPRALPEEQGRRGARDPHDGRGSGARARHAHREAIHRALDARNTKRRKKAPAPSPLRAALDARRAGAAVPHRSGDSPAVHLAAKLANRASSALRASYTPSRASSSASVLGSAQHPTTTTTTTTPRPSPRPPAHPSPQPSPLLRR